VTPTAGFARVLVFRSFPLDTKKTEITRALVVVHGAGRDADNYFRHVLAAAFLAGALDDTVVISPRFASNNGDCHDAVAEREARWQCRGPARWTVGGGAVDDERTTSFDVADEILRRLARRAAFPSLKTIVLVGHSAGGQFVSRYQMANQVHETLGLPIHYVIANPSSYGYADAMRPSPSLLAANPSALAPGYVVALPASAPDSPFIKFADADNCTTYDRWPYGLRQRVGYSARLTDDQLKKQLSSRRATYLLGGLDILPLFNFDGSCSAMAQGPTRLARGLAYVRYVNERFAAGHDALVVRACGHSARCMFTDNAALGLLFPKP
jgi:pimeloyl-ACP methyl ester carboxylesterase